ncbi:MAG: pyridoxal-phosphate dependent enzyme [Galactobacter sp.]
MRFAESVLDLIGHTPLVRLNSVTEGIEATVLAKVEFVNPGGSVKDRIAVKMIQRAEENGELTPGGTIVEPTSGNTGVGLALVGALRGYDTVFVTPDKVGKEKRDVLAAYGARVVVTPTSVAPDSPESYYSVADRIVAETPGAYKPDQFANPGAPDSHYETTGPEIWEDTDGLVTHAVLAAGTGGTITGTGRYLHDISAGRESGPVQVIAADPDGSVYSGGTGRPYFTEGVGEDMWPGNYDSSVPDRIEAVTDAEAFAMTQRLAREEGLLVGGSSGMAVVAALRVARELPASAVVVVLLPDSGRGYLGKIFDPEWMRAHGFAGSSPVPDGGSLMPDGAVPASADRHRPAVPGSVGFALKARRSPRVGLPLSTPVSVALEALSQFEVEALPVLAAAIWPAREGEVRGSVSAAGLAAARETGAITLDSPLADVLAPALPTVGVDAPLSSLFELWGSAPAVAVLRDGELVDVVAASDLILN